jgi:hypothetical protein
VDRLWRDPEAWTATAVRNVAAMGRFSSDRTIGSYAAEIWGVRPVPVELGAAAGGRRVGRRTTASRKMAAKAAGGGGGPAPRPAAAGAAGPGDRE